jgi:hypothetical protein
MDDLKAFASARRMMAELERRLHEGSVSSLGCSVRPHLKGSTADEILTLLPSFQVI